MANYEFCVCSDTFKIKEENRENVQRAISYFEESEVDSKGNAFIGSYEQTLSDDLLVLIDKRTNKVICTFDDGYSSIEDAIEEYCDVIEEDLKKANIPSNFDEAYDVEDFDTVPFAEYIQSVLVDGDYALIKEVGHEKLRYAVGCGLLITKKSIKWIDIDSIAMQYIEEEKN